MLIHREVRPAIVVNANDALQTKKQQKMCETIETLSRTKNLAPGLMSFVLHAHIVVAINTRINSVAMKEEKKNK